MHYAELERCVGWMRKLVKRITLEWSGIINDCYSCRSTNDEHLRTLYILSSQQVKIVAI